MAIWTANQTEILLQGTAEKLMAHSPQHGGAEVHSPTLPQAQTEDWQPSASVRYLQTPLEQPTVLTPKKETTPGGSSCK